MAAIDNGWSILCLKLTNGLVSPLAKTKRDLSAREMRRYCHKFRNDEDYAGEAVYTSSRLRFTPDELRKLPTI